MDEFMTMRICGLGNGMCRSHAVILVYSPNLEGDQFIQALSEVEIDIKEKCLISSPKNEFS